MAGVAEQRDAALAPLRQAGRGRTAPSDSIPSASAMIAADRFRPAGVVGGEVGLVAAFGPAFVLPIAAFDDADEIHEFAAAQIIRDGVTAGTDPDACGRRDEVLGQAVCRNDDAPGDVAGEARRGPRRTYAFAHARVDAVGADEDVALRRACRRRTSRRRLCAVRAKLRPDPCPDARRSVRVRAARRSSTAIKSARWT